MVRVVDRNGLVRAGMLCVRAALGARFARSRPRYVPPVALRCHPYLPTATYVYQMSYVAACVYQPGRRQLSLH
jgi:hypothetical protein